jgi:hypothetical protein
MGLYAKKAILNHTNEKPQKKAAPSAVKYASTSLFFIGKKTGHKNNFLYRFSAELTLTRHIQKKAVNRNSALIN